MNELEYRKLIVNNISNGKKIIEKEKFLYQYYNSFMILQHLMRNERLTPYLLPFNYKEYRSGDSYLHYLALYTFIPKEYRKFIYVKTKNINFSKNEINAVIRYFNVSERKANMYLQTMTKKQIKELTNFCLKTELIENE